MASSGMSTAPKIQLSRSGYHCLLDAQPDFLVPSQPEHKFDIKRLIRSTNASLGSAARTEAPFANNVATGPDVAWVTNPYTEVVLPYQLRPHTADVLRATPIDSAVATQLRPSTLLALTHAGILIDPKHALKEAESFLDDQYHRQAKFRRSKYSPLGSPIHPFHIGALRRYLRYKIRTGAIWLGDAQSKHRYVAHNEPVVRYFHHQLTKLMSATVGQPVKPSYVYFASYQDGADLKKHTDREQCEFSITMQIDFSPEPRGKTPWPICLEVNGKAVKVRQALGDALLYKGIELPHFRSRIPRGCTSTSIFFHYVPAGFKGPLE
jgi:hypothetical protein